MLELHRVLNMPEYAWIIPGELLLPLGTEGVGRHELYPANDIPNKYIYICFFNDLFIYFIVVFPLFGTPKELIRDSQSL